jgi:hypothetical protein
MHLIGMHLMGVHLIGIHFTGMYLIGVHLIDMYLTGVHLIGVYLTGMHLMGMSGETRSPFNYLVPILQNKQDKEEEGKRGRQAGLNRLEKGAASGCAEDEMPA